MMTVPIYGGSRRAIGFRIAGTTAGTIDVTLYRGGWNRQRNDGQEERFFEFRINAGHFDQFNRIDQKFDDDDTFIATVVAKGESRVYMLAAEFE
jgi:hypothetical protein